MDTSTLLKFIDTIHVEPDLFRKQVVDSFASILGYENCDFWLAKRDGHLYEPVTSVSKEFIDEFQHTYYRQDLLHPLQVGVDTALKHDLMTLDHIASPETLKESQYYWFLHKYGFGQQLTIYLKDRHGLIGAIALLRSEHDKRFDETDYQTLRTVVSSISSQLHLSLLLRQSEQQGRLFRNVSDLSSTGIIVFGESFKLHYSNSAAREICGQFAGRACSDGDLESFVRKFIQNCSLDWIKGIERSIMTPKFESVRISVLPPSEANPNEGRCLFTMLIDQVMEESVAHHSVVMFEEKRAKAFNLTFRELELVNLLRFGYTNQQIADRLLVSTNTVKKHLTAIFAKTGAKNRSSLIYMVNSLATMNSRSIDLSV